MIRQPTESTLTDTHFPYATLFRSGREKQSLIVRYSFQGPISGHSLSAIRPDFWAKARYGEYEYGSRHAPWRGRGGRPDELVRRSSPSPPPPAYRPDCPGIHPAREYRWRCQAPCHGEARSSPDGWRANNRYGQCPPPFRCRRCGAADRSEEHTSELQSLMSN